jgi:hypothetical protein
MGCAALPEALAGCLGIADSTLILIALLASYARARIRHIFGTPGNSVPDCLLDEPVNMCSLDSGRPPWQGKCSSGTAIQTKDAYPGHGSLREQGGATSLRWKSHCPRTERRERASCLSCGWPSLPYSYRSEDVYWRWARQEPRVQVGVAAEQPRVNGWWEPFRSPMHDLLTYRCGDNQES